MLHRAKKVIFGGVLFVAFGGAASAAVPNDGVQPPDKPLLNRASPMINDPATSIYGNAPITIRVPKPDIQADLPDPTKAKPPLYRASPMINDQNIHGTAPTGTNMAPRDDVQADVPDTSKPPLYHASPMINDPLIGKPIQGKPPQ